MTDLKVIIDKKEPVTITALVKDSTQVFISDTSMQVIFGKSAHLQITEKSVLACVEDLCVPYSKQSKKNDVLEENKIWYINLEKFSLTIGKRMKWVEEGKSIEIISLDKKSMDLPETSESTAPDFSLKDKNGETVSLSDFRGKKVLVSLWASW